MAKRSTTSAVVTGCFAGLAVGARMLAGVPLPLWLQIAFMVGMVGLCGGLAYRWPGQFSALANAVATWMMLPFKKNSLSGAAPWHHSTTSAGLASQKA